MRSLIHGGADVNIGFVIRQCNSCTALVQASKFNHPSVVEALPEAGADVNFASPEIGYTVLMLAYGASSEACVRALLAGGADPRLVAHGELEGLTALGLAKCLNHPAIAALLEAKLRELPAGCGV